MSKTAVKIRYPTHYSSLNASAPRTVSILAASGMLAACGGAGFVSTQNTERVPNATRSVAKRYYLFDTSPIVA